MENLSCNSFAVGCKTCLSTFYTEMSVFLNGSITTGKVYDIIGNNKDDPNYVIRLLLKKKSIVLLTEPDRKHLNPVNTDKDQVVPNRDGEKNIFWCHAKKKKKHTPKFGFIF